MSLLLSLLSGASLVLPAPPTPDVLQSQWVAADARWLAHVDVERMLDSTILREVRRMAEAHGEDLGDFTEAMEEIRAELGFNPIEDVKSVTIYSRGQSPEEAVALIEVAHPDQIREAMAKGPGHRTQDADGYVLHTWGDGDHAGLPGRAEMCATLVEIEDTDRALLVASETTGRLTDAMDVLVGRRANMATGEHRVLNVKPHAGAWFVAAAKGLDGLPELEGASRFSKGAKDLLLEMGQQGDDSLYLSLDVETENANTATSLVQIVQGGLAILRLGMLGEGDEDAQKLLGLANGLQIRSEGAHLSVRLECSQDDLRKLQGDHGAHHAEHADGGDAGGEAVRAHKSDRRR